MDQSQRDGTEGRGVGVGASVALEVRGPGERGQRQRKALGGGS